MATDTSKEEWERGGGGRGERRGGERGRGGGGREEEKFVASVLELAVSKVHRILVCSCVIPLHSSVHGTVPGQQPLASAAHSGPPAAGPAAAVG